MHFFPPLFLIFIFLFRADEKTLHIFQFAPNDGAHHALRRTARYSIAEFFFFTSPSSQQAEGGKLSLRVHLIFIRNYDNFCDFSGQGLGGEEWGWG